MSKVPIHTAGYTGIVGGLATTFPLPYAKDHICPCGIANDRVHGSSTSELFKTNFEVRCVGTAVTRESAHTPP